jgi:hypothetical protein
MKYYTEVIDRSESHLISLDRNNRHRRNSGRAGASREPLPQPRKPQRASRKLTGLRAESDAPANPLDSVAALAPL